MALLTREISTLIPRCRSKLHSHDEFRMNSYKELLNEPCNGTLNSVCRKNITISYFEMEPFSTGENFTTMKSYTNEGLIQKILFTALSECCGSCLNITFRKVANRSVLISVKNKESSNILFPIFTQGRIHQFNSTLPLFTIPMVQLSGAMFITKSTISAKLFAEEVVMAIIEIWPLLGVAILLAFAAGVIIWIIDTWGNKEHFPRRFVTGAFEGKKQKKDNDFE